MRKKLAAVFLVLLILLSALPALANSSMPPTLTVRVQDEPADLALWLEGAEGSEGAVRGEKIKGVYRFYSLDPDKELSALRVKTGGKEYSFDVTSEMFKNGARLSFSSGEPKLTAMPDKTLISVLLNVLLTLAIEFAVLLLFGYRKGRTFLIFLITNLITQAAFNLFLYSDALASVIPFFIHSLFALIIAEILVILIEGAVYCLTFREHSRGRAWGYAVAANAASALLGTLIVFLISLCVS